MFLFKRKSKSKAAKKSEGSAFLPELIKAHHKEAIGIIVGTLFWYLSAALLSFCPHDKSFFYYTSMSTGWSNWCGMIGAYCASLFFYFLGSAAYVLVPALWWGLYSWWSAFYERIWLRVIAFGTFIVVFSTLPVAHQALWGRLEPGLIGLKCALLLELLLGQVGSLLVLYNLVWLSAVIVARISFVTLCRGMSWVMYMLAHGVALLADRLWRVIRVGAIAFFSFIKWGARGCWNVLAQHYAEESIAQVPEMVQPATTPSASHGVLDELAYFARLSTESVPHVVEQPMHAAEAVQQGSADVIHKAQSALAEYSATMQQKPVLLIPPADLFAHKQLFTRSHQVSIKGKYLLKRLPNTVINRNIVTFRDPHGRTLIECAALSIKAQESKISKPLFVLPDISLFQDRRTKVVDPSHLEKERYERGQRLQEKLQHFGIKGEVVAINPGPVITVYEYKPDINSKISKIIALEDDLAMALTAMSIRIVAPIPGKDVVGFEIANQTRQDVFLSEILQGKETAAYQGKLPIVLGVDSVGDSVVEDLASMPHLLVAGSTGSGKSVGMHAMLVSMLSKRSPDELKLVLVDPKRLEFAPYADIPHLLFPIVTNMRAVAPVLKWVVHEMEGRYEKMSRLGVRNINEYHKTHGGSGHSDMPYIVVMIDELADLMMVAGKEVEVQLARIAQMARAAGIHMIVATQRPSVDVVTGVIKVNFPSRIAFRVSSKIDSRTILDSSGAEKLLGRGDMLFMSSSSGHLRRVHGAYVSEKEVEKLTSYLKAMRKVEYLDLEKAVRTANAASEDEEEPLYSQVCELLKTLDDVSISMLQRHLRIGFNRSARLMERLESDGLIAPAQGSKPRKVIR